jgi:hypothetical protein
VSSLRPRPDGGTDARTLLPGINLQILLPDGSGTYGDYDASGGGAAAEPEGGQGGLAVMQTPKGLSLREALSRELSLRATTSPFGTPPSPASLPASPTFLEAAASALSTESPGRLDSAPGSFTLRPRMGRTTADPAFTKWWGQKVGTNLESVVVPPPPDQPDASPTEAPPLTPTEAFSPVPLAGVSVDGRAAAAMQMWPIIAAFTPRMLRDDILLPPACRRFVAADDPSTATDPAAPHERAAGIGSLSCALPAALAVADISGFTALTEALSQEGTHGVELLTR